MLFLSFCSALVQSGRVSFVRWVKRLIEYWCTLAYHTILSISSHSHCCHSLSLYFKWLWLKAVLVSLDDLFSIEHNVNFDWNDLISAIVFRSLHSFIHSLKRIHTHTHIMCTSILLHPSYMYCTLTVYAVCMLLHEKRPNTQTQSIDMQPFLVQHHPLNAVISWFFVCVWVCPW